MDRMTKGFLGALVVVFGASSATADETSSKPKPAAKPGVQASSEKSNPQAAPDAKAAPATKMAPADKLAPAAKSVSPAKPSPAAMKAPSGKSARALDFEDLESIGRFADQLNAAGVPDADTAVLLALEVGSHRLENKTRKGTPGTESKSVVPSVQGLVASGKKGDALYAAIREELKKSHSATVGRMANQKNLVAVVTRMRAEKAKGLSMVKEFAREMRSASISARKASKAERRPGRAFTKDSIKESKTS